MTGPANTIQYLLVLIAFVLSMHDSVSAATISMTVAQQSVSKGDTFIVEWYLDTQGKAVNVVDATLYYSPETLEVEDIVTGSSALSLWIEQPRVVEDGTIKFTGGIPAGVTGTRIPIVRTLFRAANTGSASIALGKDAQVVLSDGVATIESVTMEPIVFPVLAGKARVIDSPTHPNQEKWYTGTTLELRITEKNPVVYSLSTNPDITPAGEPQVITDMIRYENLQDGIYYFKVAVPVQETFQELETYRILIDTTAPSISAEIDTNSELFDQKASLSFYAIDKTAGIAHTKVKTGWFGLYREATSPYRLHKPLFGNVVKIKTIDKAGNDTLSTLYFRGYLANWMSYCVTLVVLICLLYICIRKRASLRSITKKVLRRLYSRLRSSA